MLRFDLAASIVSKNAPAAHHNQMKLARTLLITIKQTQDTATHRL